MTQLTKPQKDAIAAYITNQYYLLETIVHIIHARLVIAKEKRITSTEVALALSGFNRVRRWSDPEMLWRTRVIISTAIRHGIFNSSYFELRPGVGFRLKSNLVPFETKKKSKKPRAKSELRATG